MKIIGLNGSPHGKDGATLAHFNHAKKYFPENAETIVYNIGVQLKTIEKKEKKILEIIDQILNCDLLVWIYPVYIFHLPANVIRFIELVKERHVEDAFHGKYAFMNFLFSHEKLLDLYGKLVYSGKMKKAQQTLVEEKLDVSRIKLTIQD